MMPRYPWKIYRNDIEEESAWETLDSMEIDEDFTIAEVWNSCAASYGMCARVIRQAIANGSVQYIGRLKVQGAPKVFRRVV